MNKNITMIVVSILVVVSVASVFFINAKKDSGVINKPSEPVVENESLMTEDEENKNSNIDKTIFNDNYMIYSEDSFREASDKKRVIYFYANWCPICQPVDKDFKNNPDEIPDEIVIFRVNYDDSATDNTEKELANKYDITYQHTFVLVDENGNELEKWNGGSIDELLKRVN